ncbi:MAG: hypothetical protein EOO73_33255 [Myxococcales bacterium]|nr:MAG: hypothetical protein EOO73_33255 [Myxococcales bacterium]
MLLGARPAGARARGIAIDSCSGCHGNPEAAPPKLTVTANPADFGPGDSVRLTLQLSSASIAVGGLYVTTSNVGTLRSPPGSRLAPQGQGLAHTAPYPAVAGVVTFEVDWQAPPVPGAVRLSVAALAGNGNGASTGDAPVLREFDWTFGCESVTSSIDLDRDGYGAKALGTRLHCAGEPAPTGFADLDGDCDENDEKAHPGGTEVCNRKDDDCDGLVDEDVLPVTLWPDADGDGFYSTQTGVSKLGCGDVRGYAAAGGDCDDLDAEIHPNADETCNARDDDCDGDVDERVRPQCGTGWCNRYSSTCDVRDCRPGEPRAETCNAFDDDCDGELDNGACVASPCGGGECGGSAGSAPSAPSAAGSSGAEPLPAGGASSHEPPSSPGCSLASQHAGWAGGLAVVLASLGLLRRKR